MHFHSKWNVIISIQKERFGPSLKRHFVYAMLASYLFLINCISYCDMLGSYITVFLKRRIMWKIVRKDFTKDCEKTNNSFDI